MTIVGLLNGLVGLLVAGMSALVCAIIYWCIQWVEPWLITAVYYVPGWLSTTPALMVDGLDYMYRVGNIFLPIEEGVPLVIVYWTFMLAMKIYALVNSLRKL